MSEVPIILTPTEVEEYIRALQPSAIERIGSLKWFEEHKNLERLRQQCIIEASHNVEERVKDLVLATDKLPVLIHEAICSQIWRQKVWRKVLKVKEKKLINGFIGYMIMYHECTAVNLLQILFHHKDTVESLGEEALDIIDYCASNTIYLLSTQMQWSETEPDEGEFTQLKQKQGEMSFNNGLASVAILAALSEYVGELSLSAVVRLYNTHDVPVLIANLLEVHPWKKKQEKGAWRVYQEGNWQTWFGEELTKTEAQCWIALRGLLLHPAVKENYEMTTNRRQTLLKLQRHLQESVIDQMAPLVELKQLLGHLSVATQNNTYKPPLILETIAPITESLLSKGSKWRKLADLHIALMFEETQRENAMEIAKSVAETYDADILACLNITKISDDGSKCSLCGKTATKKCSQCKTEWYCSRKCQVNHWSTHKNLCLIAESSRN